MPESILKWGISLILALQDWGDWLITPMNILTFLGDQDFFLIALPLVYWCWNRRLGVWLGVMLVLSFQIALLLKVVFHSPRPGVVQN